MQQLEGDALHTYIASLVNSPAMQAQTRYCENQIVHAVLQNKMPRIAEAGIHADIAVSLPSRSLYKRSTCAPCLPMAWTTP